MKKLIYRVLGLLFLLSLSGYAKSTIVVTQEKALAVAKQQKEQCLSLLNLDNKGDIKVKVTPFDGLYLVKAEGYDEDEKLAVSYLKLKTVFPNAFIMNEVRKVQPAVAPKIKVVEKRVVVTKEVDVEKEDNTLWIALFGLAIIGILYMFLSSDQIKRLKESHERMKEKYKMLEEKQHHVLSSMGENIHTIAKETIDQTSKLVEKSKETDLHEDIKQVMHNESELLNRTGDLIKFLQLKSKKIVLVKEVFNFDNMLHEVIGMLTESAKKQQTNLIFDIDTNVSNKMLTDSSHLSQILVNLLEYYVQNTIENKVKLYITTKSSISEGKRLHITIDGTVKIQDKKSFFETYYDEVSKRYVGLGIFVAKELIDLMDGELTIHTQAQYDTLQITLPIEEPSRDKRKYRLSQKKIMESRVLIVENDLDIAAALEKRLSYFQITASTKDRTYLLQNLTQLSQYDILMIAREVFETLSTAQMQSIEQYDRLKIVILENLYKTYPSILSDRVNSVLCKPFSPEYVYEVIDGLYLPQKKDKQESKVESRHTLPVHRALFEDVQNLTLDMFRNFANKTLLIVEDNIINQKVVKGVLSKSNMHILVANNGEEAIALLEKNAENIDFVLMDISMPVMDGFVATEKIRQDKRFDHIPIVSLTALVAEHEIEKIFDVGMNGYLSKPIKVEKLYTAMRFFLGDAKVYEPSKPQKVAEPIQLKGLNIEEGLARMQNNPVFYKEVLREFIDAYAKSDVLYETLVHEKRYGQARILALDMKGLAETIGANQMHVLMNEIYKTISIYKKPQLLDRYIEPYKQELKILKTSIDTYLKMDT